MENIGPAIGGKAIIKIDGQSYSVDPPDMEIYASLANHIAGKRPNPLRAAVEAAYGSTPEITAVMMRAAADAAAAVPSVTLGEVQKFAQTPEGFIFSTWLLLDRATPGKFSLEYIDAYIKRLSPTEAASLFQSIDTAAGGHGNPTTGGSSASK